MNYVTDTHALLWHVFLPQRLGHTARTILTDVDANKHHIYIPAVVVAEMIMVVQRGRLPNVTMPQLLAVLSSLEANSNYTLLPLFPMTVIASHLLVAIPDIFDRLIVAEAQRLGCPLISKDGILQAVGVVSVVWD